MANIIDRFKDLIYGSAASKPLTPQQAKEVAEQVKHSVISMRGHCAWADVEVNAAIEMARSFPKGHPRHEHYRRTLKLRLVMQQYMEKMSLALETINSQVELAELSAEMGKSLQGATQLVNTYKRDMPSFTGLVRSFMRAIAPMKEAMDGGLDEMSEALDQLCGCSLDGVYSEADLDALISGQVSAIEPVIPMKPAETVQAAASAAEPMDDLLSSIERTLPSLDKHGN